MTNSDRLQANILAAEISGTAYSLEKLVLVEPTAFTEHLQEDKLIEYTAAMNEKMKQLNAIIEKHFSSKQYAR
jgi:hypothetical protein